MHRRADELGEYTLRALLLEGDELPKEGQAVLHHGQETGHLTTVAFSPRLDRLAGLSILHRRASEPGSRVTLEDGREAEVAALPLASGEAAPG